MASNVKDVYKRQYLYCSVRIASYRYVFAGMAEPHFSYRTSVEGQRTNLHARADIPQFNAFVCRAGDKSPPIGRHAVSYTHLDVYKRQSPSPESTSPGRW